MEYLDSPITIFSLSPTKYCFKEGIYNRLRKLSYFWYNTENYNVKYSTQKKFLHLFAIQYTYINTFFLSTIFFLH